jgi:hypothetical protein
MYPHTTILLPRTPWSLLMLTPLTSYCEPRIIHVNDTLNFSRNVIYFFISLSEFTNHAKIHFRLHCCSSYCRNTGIQTILPSTGIEVNDSYSGQLELYIFQNVHDCPTIKYFPTSRSHTETTNGSGRSCPIQP